jgi:hypothetical protein
MRRAIFDREERLEEANRSVRELLDHMRQAIVVFGPDGLVSGAQSRQAAAVFGSDDLSGRHVRDLLFSGVGAWDAELRAFNEWLDLAFEMPPAEWGALEELAPREVHLRSEGDDPAERVLALEFRPVVSEGRVGRVMLLATDETEKSRLRREFREQGEQHARQMATLRRLVSGGGQLFVAFLTGARSRLTRARELLSSAKAIPLGELDESFQNIHTLRGEARAFQLDELASILNGLEERLATLREQALLSKDRRVAIDPSDFESALKSAREVVDESERLFIEASPAGRAVLDQITVRRSDLEKLAALAPRHGGEIATISERLSAQTLGECASQLAERVPVWAESANKRVRFEIVDREELVPGPLGRVLSAALVHLVRNSIAHGIESSEEREKNGKPAIGVVRLRATPGPGRELLPTVTVEDDGRGFGENSGLNHAARTRTPVSSTASLRTPKSSEPSELSGRGMGLGAAARELALAGYVLFAEESEGSGARFVIVPKGARAASSVGSE